MNPYDHARSSAAIHGGTWEDYHRVHAWFDATKAAICHFSHRALRHHREGIETMRTAIGATVTNADGVTVDTGELGRQHLLEDCAREPVAADWLEGFKAPAWMPDAAPRAEDLAARSARRFGGTAADHLPIHAWFLETAAWADGPAHLAFRHHAFGAFEAEERFGPAITWNGGGVATRVVAENHIRTVLGRVPPASAWLQHIHGERWMTRATSPAKLGLNQAV